ncbi:MAG: peptidase M14 [Cyclobacteriaceae bacterium]|nr:peptidase M14 [Cyclobacteriaceae bacterium]
MFYSKNYSKLAAFAILLLTFSCQQEQKIKRYDDQLFADYDQYKEQSLKNRRIKHSQLQPLIDKLRSKEGIEITPLGKSIEGREISMISMGEGDIDILLWSQMHGNEPTATMAIFDILNFLTASDTYDAQRQALLKNARIHFIPMLNPDGAQKFKRRNALNIDINRDALRLQSPEGRILKRVRDSLNADFGFNLHDQSIYYNAERTEKPATLSYLATAFDYDKSVNEVREKSMQVIGFMNDIVQKYAPGQVGRYSDDFEPRAFGDNIQKWGTSLILIESGGYKNDTEKQFIRKLNYISILSALFGIADNSYALINPDEYEKIPFNDRKLFDLKIEKMNYELNGKTYVLDVGIDLNEVDNEDHTSFYSIGKVEDIGDLSTYYGYQTIDATGLDYQQGRTYLLSDDDDLSSISFSGLLNDGFVAVSTDMASDSLAFNSYPINFVKKDAGFTTRLDLGQNATFLLKNGDSLAYVILNGFVYVPGNSTDFIKNGIVNK